MTEETKTPGRAGRPRKQPKAEESNNGDSGGPVESTESVDSAPDEALASSESKVESANLEGAVDRLMDFMKGYTPMFNRKQRMSVVDLGSRHTGQGMKYRQLFVEETPGLLNVTIREGFKSSHGGTDQRNVLYGFSSSTFLWI